MQGFDKWSDVNAWFITVVNHVLDYLQFLGSSITNDLRDDQILMVRNNLSSDQNRTSMVLTLMAQVIQATITSIPLPSMLWLLVVHTDECLSTIQQRQPKWGIANYWWYKYNNSLSERLSVINNMIKTTWVKDCQLLIIQVQWQLE